MGKCTLSSLSFFTKRRIGWQGPANPSFTMTPTTAGVISKEGLVGPRPPIPFGYDNGKDLINTGWDREILNLLLVLFWFVRHGRFWKCWGNHPCINTTYILLWFGDLSWPIQSLHCKKYFTKYLAHTTLLKKVEDFFIPPSVNEFFPMTQLILLLATSLWISAI